MNAEAKQKLVEAGIDYEGALHRFLNNEAMYEKFLLKFPDDANYSGIMGLLAEGKYEEIFSFAHTLKGTAGNLGLEPVRVVASSLTEMVRGKSRGEIDTAAVDRQIELLTEAHTKVCDLIKNLG